ncbi:phage tail spike protein [Gracilibacillus saliphilus]|uniref:phage tail spike protein n=1 Tax=Gracilibacillus saliphilus TaxID=543890 RepID=UPI0013D85304|nr:phage tail spike protein [Gracilibacillus saliphilus]
MQQNLTQVGGQFIGNVGVEEQPQQGGASDQFKGTIIHIADHQLDTILDDITEDGFWDDKHTKAMKNNKETFDFITFGDKPYSEYLAKRNRIIIPDEDGRLVEFFITNTDKFHKRGVLTCEVRTSATYVTLKTAKSIAPHTTNAISAEAHAQLALDNTEWEPGTVAFNGVRTFTFEDYTNPYAYLNRIASEFDLELHFRVESNGNRIVRRYVDLIERVGGWQGREVEFGKDLEKIERKEDNSNIVTALVGVGPEREDGTRLEVLVEDQDALERWGRNGRHIIEVYEPQSTDQNMTETRLRTLTENELEKRVNSVVEYRADVVDLENVPGLEHEKFRFGDTIKIKDLKFNPPLYLEARVHTVERSIKRNGKKTIELGDYIEYTEEEIFNVIKSLRKELFNKENEIIVSSTEPEDTTSKWLDTSVTPNILKHHNGVEWIKATPTNADEIGESTNRKWAGESGADITGDHTALDTQKVAGRPASDIEDKQGSQEKANTAETNANDYTDTNALVKEKQYTNGLYWDDIDGLFVLKSNGLTRTVLNATRGIAIQKRSSITDTWEDVFYVDDNGNIQYAGNLDGATGVFRGSVEIANTVIDTSGILTNEGDFRVKDEVTQLETSMMSLPNMVNDHSFELVPLGTGTWANATRRVDYSRMQNYYNWMIVGEQDYARIQSTLSTGGYKRAKYGFQAAILEQRYYWVQYLRLDADRTVNGPYTISAYFSAYEDTNSVTTCRLLVHAYDSDFNLTQTSSVGGFTIDVNPNETYTWKRAAATFTNLPAGTVFLRIRIDQITGNSTRALCDGVQMVPIEYPTMYQPEESLWNYLNGVVGYS